MQYEEAKELIIREGTSLDGVYMCVRERQDPGHERMMRIKQAVEVLKEFEDLTMPIE